MSTTEEEQLQQVVSGAQYENAVQDSLKEEIPSNQYTTIDENIIDAVQNDPDIEPLFPLYSHLIRLTDISGKDKVRMQNNVDLIIGALEIGMSSKDYDSGKWAKLQSHGIFLKLAPCDSVKGFKMRLLSRSRRELSIEPPERKKKHFW
jgi:hypothetical protein